MRRRWMIILEVLAMLAVLAWVGWSFADHGPRPPDSVDIKIQVSNAADKAFLFRDKEGKLYYRITTNSGQEDLTPEAFAMRMYVDQRSRGWMERLANVSSPLGIAWVVMGLAGQVLFTGRMVVQWLASEKEKRSVVPPVFWWMSLIGSSMLLAYFLWRKDPVGVLGQAFGWFIYLRNLWMIYRK